MKNATLLLFGSLAGSAAVCYAIYSTKSAGSNSEVDQLKGELAALKDQIQRRRILMVKAATACAVTFYIGYKARSFILQLTSQSQHDDHHHHHHHC